MPLSALPIAGASPINGILPSLVVLLCWLPYHARVRTLAEHRRPVPAWRQACFAAGLISLAVNGGDAAEQLGLPPGAHVRLSAAVPA